MTEMETEIVWSPGRGEVRPFEGTSKRYEQLSRFFAKTVTGPFNQDISFLIVGKKGTGKSYCHLSLAYTTACEIAEIEGGTWTDYFDIERNLAIIDPVKANEVMGIQDKYAVKMYDDIGVGWGARDWQKDENKAKNDIFQINRVDNQVQMFSVPNQFLLDKVPRSLVSHYAETYQQFFKLGFVTIKLFEPQTLFREGKIVQPYISVNRNKFVVFAIHAPPPELSKKYNQLRQEVTKKIVQMRRETVADKLEKAGQPRVHPNVEKGRMVRERVENALKDLKENEKWTRLEACNNNEITVKQFERYAPEFVRKRSSTSIS